MDYQIDYKKKNILSLETGASLTTLLYMKTESLIIIFCYYYYYYYYYYYLVPFACTGGGGAITAVTSCMQHPSTISTTYLETLTDAGAVAGNIDRTSHMLNDRIYIFDGISDTVVDPGMCNLIFFDCS